jgi:hypothetical protein
MSFSEYSFCCCLRVPSAGLLEHTIRLKITRAEAIL